MHPCIVCGKTIQHDEIFQYDLIYKNNIIYKSEQRIVNLICDDCIGNNIEGVSAVYLCEACHESFSMMWEEEVKLGSDRATTEYTLRGLRRKFVCDKCYQDNWKFTEHGVLINETPVKKKKK